MEVTRGQLLHAWRLVSTGTFLLILVNSRAATTSFSCLFNRVMGYYINFYGLGPETRIKNQYPEHRFDESMGQAHRRANGQCLHIGYDQCKASADRKTCHRLNPMQMVELNSMRNVTARVHPNVEQLPVVSTTTDQPSNELNHEIIDGTQEMKKQATSDFTTLIPTRSAPLHSAESLTSFIWEKGQRFNPQSVARSARTGLTIDALSIGSKFSAEKIEGQLSSWASHPSIRYLFGSTEQDDNDPYCHVNLNITHLYKITKRCSGETFGGHKSRLKPLRAQYPSFKWLEKVGKTPGKFRRHCTAQYVYPS